MKKLMLISLLTITIIFISGCVVDSNGIQDIGQDTGTSVTGTEAVPCADGYSLNVTQQKESILCGETIQVTYLESSPKHKLEIRINEDIETIEINREPVCYKTEEKCETIIENDTKITDCKNVTEPTEECDFYIWTYDKLIDYEGEEVKLGASVKPLKITQDKDDDGLICEDPCDFDGVPRCDYGGPFGCNGEGTQIDNDNDGEFNEDWQTNYYDRSSWEVDTLEIGISGSWVKKDGLESTIL